MYDIVIPYHPKDRKTMPLCLEQIGRHLRGYRHVYVVGETALQETFMVGLRELPEPDHQHIKHYLQMRKSPFVDRAGWIFQTLLKLQAKKYIPDLLPEYLVVDADVLFLRHVPFFEEEGDTSGPGPWFQYNHWARHEQYADVYERLTGKRYLPAHGFVMHHMMYRQERLDEMIEHICDYTGSRNFDEAVLKNINVCNQSPFAECDTFGAWMLGNHPEECERRQIVMVEKPFVPKRLWLDVHEDTEWDMVTCHAYMRVGR